MSLFDRGRVGDDRFLTQIGTLSGNPVAAVAGLATLEVLRRPGAYDKVFATGRELMAGMTATLEKAGLPAQVIGVPPLFDIVYAAGDIADYRGWLRADTEMQRRFNRRFRDGGILKGESKFYVSLAHDAADVKHTLDVVKFAVEAELAETRVPAQ
jgi:glutamate-1-semialdehyde 2,1-aminomutase